MWAEDVKVVKQPGASWREDLVKAVPKKSNFETYGCDVVTFDPNDPFATPKCKTKSITKDSQKPEVNQPIQEPLYCRMAKSYMPHKVCQKIGCCLAEKEVAEERVEPPIKPHQALQLTTTPPPSKEPVFFTQETVWEVPGCDKEAGIKADQIMEKVFCENNKDVPS